ncbi:hypothetical protein J3R74_002521 [Puniceicoccus vermicola]
MEKQGNSSFPPIVATSKSTKFEELNLHVAMHISLTPELDRAVREKVASGLCNNASEVIREALRTTLRAIGDCELRISIHPVGGELCSSRFGNF